MDPQSKMVEARLRAMSRLSSGQLYFTAEFLQQPMSMDEFQRLAQAVASSAHSFQDTNHPLFFPFPFPDPRLQPQLLPRPPLPSDQNLRGPARRLAEAGKRVGQADTKRTSEPDWVQGWCSLCDARCNTIEALHRYHIPGKKHQHFLKALCDSSDNNEKDIKTENKEDGKNNVEDDVKQEENKEEVKIQEDKESEKVTVAKKEYTGIQRAFLDWCSLCKVHTGSLENLHKAHISGRKHQTALEKNNWLVAKAQSGGQDNKNQKRKRGPAIEENGSSSMKVQKKLENNDSDKDKEADLPNKADSEQAESDEAEDIGDDEEKNVDEKDADEDGNNQ